MAVQTSYFDLLVDPPNFYQIKTIEEVNAINMPVFVERFESPLMEIATNIRWYYFKPLEDFFFNRFDYKKSSIILREALIKDFVNQLRVRYDPPNQNAFYTSKQILFPTPQASAFYMKQHPYKPVMDKWILILLQYGHDVFISRQYAPLSSGNAVSGNVFALGIEHVLFPMVIFLSASLICSIAFFLEKIKG